MAMASRKTIRRKSWAATDDAQPSRGALSPAAAAERNAKGYTWAFDPAASLDHATSDVLRQEQVETTTAPLQLCRSTSWAALPFSSIDAFCDSDSEVHIRPRSAGSVLDSGSVSSKHKTLPTIMEQRHVEISTRFQPRNATPIVKRWDAKSRTASTWDSLRRDSELFSQRANCSIHFYDKGQSRRGPSLRIPLDRLYSARFESLFTLFRTTLHDDVDRDEMQRQCDLYIPAPDESSRKDAFTWHITTRNFFAFILGRPLVGTSLGRAVIDLRDRLDVFRPKNPRNQTDLMIYLDRLGYLNIAHCPDYAVAMLTFAEQSKIQELWIDAFVHCVGMNDQLRTTGDYENVSRVSHALITRAYLEMDLHLGRVAQSLSTFLEDDFSPSNFGVSAGARLHLDRFRTFLNEYYVGRFGYWPPPKQRRFSKALYHSMYLDFRNLHDYLVDSDSTDLLADQKPAAGGICVLQNVKAFDERHNYMPLPHPHPLLPLEAPFNLRAAPQGSRVRSFVRSSKPDPVAELAWTRDALVAASNSLDPTVTTAPLVRAYQRFEREYLLKPEERLSVWDARKVRWLLVYGTLQMLISVTRAPKEVRMTETKYPLCCLVTESLPWEAGINALISTHTPSVLPPLHVSSHLDVPETSLHPDCEEDNYISSTVSLPATSTISRVTSKRLSRISSNNDTSPSPPTRTGLFRNASIRSVQTITSSIGSIRSFRSTSKRRSIGPVSTQETASTSTLTSTSGFRSRPKGNFCEIVVHGYGNGMSGASQQLPANLVPAELAADSLPEIVVSSQSPPSSPPRKEKSSDKSDTASPALRRIKKSQELSMQGQHTTLELQAPEPCRSPLIDGFDKHLPGLDAHSDTASLYSTDSVSNSTSTPVVPVWSTSRSNSPHSSATSQTATDSPSEDFHSSCEALSPVTPTSPTWTDASLSISMPMTPTSPPYALPGLLPTSNLSPKKSMDLPMVVNIEELSVYQPTGIPKITSNNDTAIADDDEEEEFPDREASRRWSVASRTRVDIGGVPIPLKSSLRRSSHVKRNKGSVRIKEEPSTVEWVSRFRTGLAV